MYRHYALFDLLTDELETWSDFHLKITQQENAPHFKEEGDKLLAKISEFLKFLREALNTRVVWVEQIEEKQAKVLALSMDLASSADALSLSLKREKRSLLGEPVAFMKKQRELAKEIDVLNQEILGLVRSLIVTHASVLREFHRQRSALDFASYTYRQLQK